MLSWLSQDNAPQLHAPVAENRARICVVEGDWAAAAEQYAAARLSRVQLYRAASTASARFGERAAAADLAHLQAFALLRLAQPDAAVSAIESARGPLFDVRGRGADPASVPAPHEAVLYLGSGAYGSYAILFRHGVAQPTAMITDLTSRQLAGPLNALDRATNHLDRARALDALAEPLARELITPVTLLLEEHPEIRSLLVVASGVLTGAPVHTIAADPRDGSTWVDRYTVRFIPSRRFIAPVTSAANKVTVLCDPGGSLAAGATETEAVRRWNPSATIAPANAGRGWVLDRLSSSRHLHLACHARAVVGDPHASGFDVGGARLLTIADLLAHDLDGLELAVVPACGSGRVAGGAPDELIGLGYGLLLAGAHRVVCSLWNVDDFATALMIHAFYRWLPELDAAEALRQAQLWLRDLTVAELRGMATDETSLGRRISIELARRSHQPQWGRGDSRPMAHRDYWGGLVYLTKRHD